MYWFGILPPIAALAFGVVLLEFGAIAWQVEWYRRGPIQWVAAIETVSAFIFLIIAALSKLR
ncbi:MAG: hypothetical protein KME17_20365 [Cyanosarcina radialis HA8281-LM2]|jgi:hypothetical protein|nr:hypothetical protein [Cyanosarcina radialis HA8281-LM2]